MKVLVIGGGGREHALVWKLLQSPHVTDIVCAPGNGGISAENGKFQSADGAAKSVTCLPWDGADINALLAIAKEQKVDLTVVGPEGPLAAGVVDLFTDYKLHIFGPTQAAAQLESSKVFAKQFMQRHNIPTAHYAVCSNMEEVEKALPLFQGKVVVKADGLAAGKGVVIAPNRDEAFHVAADLISGARAGLAGSSAGAAGTRPGSASSKIVLEECLEGDEISFLVVSDGERVAALAAAQDHKRVGDDDTGPNTGGMGAYSTAALLDAAMQEWLLAHVVRPTIAGMAAEGAPYKGVLFCGLMMTARGPYVLEYNCRFGDPEAQ